MTHFSSLGLRNRWVIILVLALTVAVSSCGGGSTDDDAPIGANEAKEAVDTFLLASLGLFTGQSEPQAFINQFAPECREEVDESEIALAMLFIQAFAPQLTELDIQQVDAGEVRVEQTADGGLVTLADPASIRIRVGDEFMPIDDVFSSIGFGADDETDFSEPLLVVRRDGEIYLGDCSELNNFSGEGSESPGAGPVTGDTTPEPSTSGPGASRSDPAPLGASVVVEDTWEITVVQVVPDAWPLIERGSSFNDPPGPNERMVLVTVLVENVSSEDQPQNIGSFEFGLTGSRNELYSLFDEDTYCGTIPEELDANLFPGGRTEGNLCAKAPSDETGLMLVWEGFFESPVFFALE